MAGQNKVTLTFAGDSSALERTMDNVGSGARDMGRKVEAQASKLDRLGEAGGNTETRFLGLGAGISGVGTLLSGDLNAETAAMAIADLGDAVEHTIAPLLSMGRAAVTAAAQHAAAAATTVAGWVTMGIQATINAAKMAAAWLISLGPVGLVIAAIGGVIAILVALGFGFDDLKRVAGQAWDFILGAAQGVWNWLKNNWPLVLTILTGPFGLAVAAVRAWGDDVVSFITGIPGRIASAATAIGSTLINGIKSGITGIGGFVSDIGAAVKGAINSALHLPFTIHGPGPLPDFTIPAFHTGGIFHAPPGRNEGLAWLQEGERVLTRGQSAGGGTVVNIYVTGSVLAQRELVDVIRKQVRIGFGGNVQKALGFDR